MKQEKKQETLTTDIFSINEIVVEVTYPFLEQTEPFKFFFKLQMSQTDKTNRAAFIGKTLEEKESSKADYHLDLLSSLLTRLPQNIPGLTSETNDLEKIKEIFKDFFSPGNPLKEQMLEDAMNLYLAKVQPHEFFRSN